MERTVTTIQTAPICAGIKTGWKINKNLEECFLKFTTN